MNYGERRYRHDWQTPTADSQKNKDTQATLAEKLQVSLATVQSWEQEKSSPSYEMLVSLCRMYQISSDYLLGLIDEDPQYIQRCQKSLSPENLNLLKRLEAYLLYEQKMNTKHN